jgi:hypothetical protein
MTSLLKQFGKRIPGGKIVSIDIGQRNMSVCVVRLLSRLQLSDKKGAGKTLLSGEQIQLYTDERERERTESQSHAVDSLGQSVAALSCTLTERQKENRRKKIQWCFSSLKMTPWPHEFWTNDSWVIEDWMLFDSISESGCTQARAKAINTNRKSIMICEAFQQRLDIWRDATWIIIESQPPSSGYQKHVPYLLQGWFIGKGIGAEKILLVPAINKITYCTFSENDITTREEENDDIIQEEEDIIDDDVIEIDDDDEKVLPKTLGEQQGVDRKKDSGYQMLFILKKYQQRHEAPNWLNLWIPRLKKWDDVADSLRQALYFASKQLGYSATRSKVTEKVFRRRPHAGNFRSKKNKN